MGERRKERGGEDEGERDAELSTETVSMMVEGTLPGGDWLSWCPRSSATS